jgi:site-specific recombinase XerC
LPYIRASSRILERDNCRISSKNHGAGAGESLEERRNDGVEETDAPETRNFLSQDEFEDGEEAALLLHTESARPIGARQVGATWKRFVCDVDPDLSGVTPMVLRASFATYMIHL